jgi:hypothetical protein
MHTHDPPGREHGGGLTVGAAPAPHPNRSPPPPSGACYSARVAFGCKRNHPPGPVLHALQELRSVIDERLRHELGRRYDHHRAQSVGDDKLTVAFALRADTPADAIRTAGAATAMLVELLTETKAAIELAGVALVVRADAE